MASLTKSRREVKPSRPFGQGILRSLPTYHAPYSQADLEWLAEEERKREDAYFDQLAEIAMADDLYERGVRLY